MEIERKFLLNSLPVCIDKFNKLEIEQGYINYEPEIRIRKANDKYYFTKKSTGDLEREEIEKIINEESYNLLSTCIQNNLIKKTRYLIPLSAKTIAEIDVYYGNLEGLKTVEVEFSTKEEALNFEIPNWFGNEVTYDKQYKNANLSKIDDAQKKKILV